MVHDLRVLLREYAGRMRTIEYCSVVFNSRTRQSTLESGARTDCDGAKRRKGACALGDHLL